MKKNYASFLVVLFVMAVLCWMYFDLMPRHVSSDTVSLSEFSTARAIDHVKEISKDPHYVGSPAHEQAIGYIDKELRRLGLETRIEQGTTLSDWGNLVPSKNIMARIKGTTSGKALLLLSHYDSAPHSYSHGAGDDASGVAVILESIRAFLHSKTAHKNDIIILFTDAEELGLNGAAQFVTQSPWAKEVGLALNFEARGTAGPGYMLMEVTQGNSGMIDAFSQADPDFPVTNSLMYSIYKMLPNDTDLTVFREHGKIQGFNFAFIDDHFNYHTAQDDFNHLSPETVAHQGSYLMPLLGYFSNSDLGTLASADDQVYFNTPVGLFHYGFWWNFVLLAIAFVLFLFLVFVGMGKRILAPKDMGKGFLLFFGALITTGIVGFFGWRIILAIHPEYTDILQGFTYNGHTYIAAFTLLAIAIGFFFYAGSKSETHIGNYAVAPLLVWLLVNLGLAVFLPGAGYFILPVFFGLAMFGYYVTTQRTNLLLNTLLSLPALFIFVPFIVMFPIGLGLKILFGSAILTVLVFSLLLPVFGEFQGKALWGIVFTLSSIGLFVYAGANSDYEPGKARPNSLLYLYDADRDKAVWATYDERLDDWTRNYLGDNPKPPGEWAKLNLFSKYNSALTFTNEAMTRDLAEPQIIFEQDSTVGKWRHLKISITPGRRVNRYDIFASEKMKFLNFKANGATALGQKGAEYPRNGRKILSYYVVDNQPLIMEFDLETGQPFEMELLEASFDLLQNPAFMMKKRADWMMPKPFILTDAIAIRKRISPTAAPVITLRVNRNFTPPGATSDTIADPDEELDSTAVDILP